MGPLDHHVGLRVIRGGEAVIDAPKLRQFRPEGRAKLRAAVECEMVRPTQAGHQTGIEGGRDDLRVGTGQWGGLQPPRRMVHDCEDVVEAFRGAEER